MQNTLAVISLKTIVHNAQAVLKRAGVPLIAVVKDDAYGHGAEAVAQSLHGVAKMFAVSTVDEGAALRNAGVTDDILVLTPPLSEEEALRCCAYGLIASLTSRAVVNLCVETAARHCVSMRAHLAVNTGMNRYGFRPENVKDALRRAEGISIEGVYSHLYLPAVKEEVASQRTLFERAVSEVKAVNPDALCHLSATGGFCEGIAYDAVRVGLALYGYLPNEWKGIIAVKPAMRLYATVAQTGTQLGGGFGYRKATEYGKKVHTLRIGYGDGLFRTGGKLCMDAWVRRGGAAFGERRIALPSVTDYARENGTTEYEVLVNVTRKSEMKYEY